MSVDSCAGMEKVIAANDLRFRVGEKRVGVGRFAAEILRLAGRIDADGDGPDAKLFEIRETLLNTP